MRILLLFSSSKLISREVNVNTHGLWPRYLYKITSKSNWKICCLHQRWSRMYYYLSQLSSICNIIVLIKYLKQLWSDAPLYHIRLTCSVKYRINLIFITHEWWICWRLHTFLTLRSILVDRQLYQNGCLQSLKCCCRFCN